MSELDDGQLSSDGQTPEVENTLVKTLTFGLGKVHGYSPKQKEFVELSDDERKKVYNSLREVAETIGQACNIEAAKKYAVEVLGVPKADQGAFKVSNPAIRRRLERADMIGGGTLSQVYKMVEPHFQGEHRKALLMTGERRLPTHRTDGTHPIPVRADVTRLVRGEKGYWLCQQIFSTEWGQQNQLPIWVAFPIKVKKRDKTMLSQLEKVLTEEWKMLTSRLMRDPLRRTWRGQLMVRYVPDPYKELSPRTILGIDLGVNSPATVHVRVDGVPQKWAQMVGNGRQMLQSRDVVRSEIKRIVRALRGKHSGLEGKARDQARERLSDLRKKERRIIKTVSQKIAAQIAEIARRNGAGVWQYEKLSSDIKAEKPWLARNWAPGILIDALRWQAAQYGAEFRPIDPAYTSQRCSVCGSISRDNRPMGKKGASHFQCAKCGHTENADKNAARNISTEGIEDLIRQSRPAKDDSGVE
jgi:putative transposase